MTRLFEFFVVCGLGPELRTVDGSKGFHGPDTMYMPSLLDQYPPDNHALYSPLPPQLPTCVLPAGVEIYSSGFASSNPSTFPRSFPIVLTEGDGSKVYVSCITFRDPVCCDISEAYCIPANSFVDKCICFVSRSPSFSVLRNALEELFGLCFSETGSSKPLWDIITHIVCKVPVPTPGKDRILFTIENTLLNVEAPHKDWLPHADISFRPLIQCLSVDNLIKLFTAVLLERRILLRSNKYSLLTLTSEAICHLIYPFRWQHVYIPLLFFSGVDYIDAPTPYMMGLHSGVDTSNLAMDGVVVVDLEYNRISTTEEIPAIPEPELSSFRSELLQLLCPNVVGIDEIMVLPAGSCGTHSNVSHKSWGENHDFQLRFIFLKFFASILSGYRNFIGNCGTNVFNSLEFLKKYPQPQSASNIPNSMMAQFLDTHGFLDYLERRMDAGGNNHNLLDKLQDAIGRGQDPISVLSLPFEELEILTISDSDAETCGAKFTYDRFPSNIRSEEQEEKRKQILAAAIGASEYIKHASSSQALQVGTESLSSIERAAERERMVLDIKVKLQGLWLRLLKLGATEDPLSSFEYGTILALIESDAEGIGGSGFVECIREHIHSGWNCLLTEEQFVAVKELLKTAMSRAISRNDVSTIRDALEVSAEMHRKDANNISDYIQRHMISLSIWDELGFWEGYYDHMMELSSSNSPKNQALQVARLVLLASHLAGLGLADADAWFVIETIAVKNNVGDEQLIKLRGFVSHVQHLQVSYWGISSMKAQSTSCHGPSLQPPHPRNSSDDSQQPPEASSIGRSWVHSMFSRDSSRKNSSSRVRRWTTDGPSAANEDGTQEKQDSSSAGPKKAQSNLRLLKGHCGAISALHCITSREVWDLVADREDAGFFISGSTDCLVKMWDPTFRDSELRATFKGHTRTVRSINSDRAKVVSGSDDHSIIVWDKQTFQMLKVLEGHSSSVSHVQMLSGERVLSSAHDGKVKMWDVRSGACLATVAHSTEAILCVEYDDSNGILAAAGRNGVAIICDIRSGRQMHKLSGHTRWIRAIRMVGDTVITGSDDWTARVWSILRGTCNAVLACHAGPVLSVEYSTSDKGLITGATDGLLRFWENEEGGSIRCAKNASIHGAAILSINAGEQWLGVGAADSSMSLFHRPPDGLSGSKSSGWQLYRTPQKMAAVVRCAACDLERKRICCGDRDGILRLWDATINI